MKQEPEHNNKKLQDFFSKEYHSLKSYINYRINESADRNAEDIIQDVALKLFSSADRYGPINNVAAFVYRSIRNKIIDIIRSKKGMNPLEEENESRLQEVMEVMYGKADNSYSLELTVKLKACILELKSDYREIIIKIDFEGYSYREISKETGIPEGTLMSRRHRAISILHKELISKKTTH